MQIKFNFALSLGLKVWVFVIGNGLLEKENTLGTRLWHQDWNFQQLFKYA